MNRRIAVISCIHGNMEALEAVFDDIRSQQADRIICLGDLVGYGPYPNETLRFIEKNGIATVMGCWDEGIAQKREDCGCKFVTEEDEMLGHAAFAWTRAKMKKKDLSFLAALPTGLRIENTPMGDIVFVHGSPRSSSEYLQESTHDLILFERAAAGRCDVLVCGHTHIPFVREVSGTLTVRAHRGVKDRIQRDLGVLKKSPPQEILLNPKLIVNAGSVGEPRDGGAESSYVLIDTEERKVEIHRVPYDVSKTVVALRKKGLPEIFADRLLQGKELAGKNKEIACAC